jgi:hypothetical protein
MMRKIALMWMNVVRITMEGKMMMMMMIVSYFNKPECGIHIAQCNKINQTCRLA